MGLRDESQALKFAGKRVSVWQLVLVTNPGRVVRDIEVNSTNSVIRSLIRTSG